MYFNDEEEKNKYAPNNWNNLSTRDVVSGLMNGKMPIQRTRDGIDSGKSPYYYLDGNGNEASNPNWGGNNHSQPQNTNFGTGTNQDRIENRFNNTNTTANTTNNNQPNQQPSTFYNAARGGEQLATSALDGLTLGFHDEAQGLMGGLGYGIANLGMKGLNKLGFDVRAPQESAWDAAKRGYTSNRDYYRQALDNGQEELPVATAVAGVAGSMASNPFGKVLGAAKTAPLGAKALGNLRSVTANGLAYGVGSTEENTPQEYATNMGLGAGSAIVGSKLGNSAFGRGDNNYLGRSLITSTVDNGTNTAYNYLTKSKEEEDEYKRQMRMKGFY